MQQQPAAMNGGEVTTQARRRAARTRSASSMPSSSSATKRSGSGHSLGTGGQSVRTSRKPSGCTRREPVYSVTRAAGSSLRARTTCRIRMATATLSG